MFCLRPFVRVHRKVFKRFSRNLTGLRTTGAGNLSQYITSCR